MNEAEAFREEVRHILAGEVLSDFYCARERLSARLGEYSVPADVIAAATLEAVYMEGGAEPVHGHLQIGREERLEELRRFVSTS